MTTYSIRYERNGVMFAARTSRLEGDEYYLEVPINESMTDTEIEAALDTAWAEAESQPGE